MTKVSMTERMVRKFRFRARISLAVILQVSVSSSTLMEADGGEGAQHKELEETFDDAFLDREQAVVS